MPRMPAAHWVGALMLAALLAAACAQPAIDEVEARAAAAGFVARSAPLGIAIEGIHVLSARQETRDARPGWLVEVEGMAIELGRTDGTIRYMILFVDGTTGEVTIEAQG